MSCMTLDKLLNLSASMSSSATTILVQKGVCFGASESWDSFNGNKAPGTVEKICSKLENVIKIDLDIFRTRISQMYLEFLVCVFFLFLYR